MPRKRPATANDHLRALRRDAACVASDLARKLQHAPAETEIVGPIVLDIFQARSGRLFSELDGNQGRYEGRDEDWSVCCGRFATTASGDRGCSSA